MINIRNAREEDLKALIAIYNHAVLTTTATFDLEEQTFEQRKEWFSQYGGKYPLIVAELDGQVVGYSSLSPFGGKEGYSRTAEFSIYIAEECRGKGIGKLLVEEVLKRASELEYHVLVSRIARGNDISIRLHEGFGFELAGCLKEVGRKFGEWQDVCFYQLVLS